MALDFGSSRTLNLQCARLPGNAAPLSSASANETSLSKPSLSLLPHIPRSSCALHTVRRSSGARAPLRHVASPLAPAQIQRPVAARSAVSQGPQDGALAEAPGFTGTETVSSVMTSMVVVATPETRVGDILEHFAYYTGLPVVDQNTLHCVGMLANIDLYKKQRGKAGSVADTHVREVMTSPVVAVFPDTLVSYAAGLMLKYKVHRLPVIDREKRVVGIVTNKDLFRTLTASAKQDSECFTFVP